MMWNLVRLAKPETHEVEVHSVPSDPLWSLAFNHSADPNSGRIQIMAGTIPPISERQKKKIVRLLRGTSKPMHEAIAELKMEFPSTYVEKAVEAHLKWSTKHEMWLSPENT